MLSAKGVTRHGEALFMVLFLLGGLGPTISPYLSFWMVKDKNGLKVYHTHLFKWKLNIFWYVIPFVISFTVLFVADGVYHFLANDSGFMQGIKPWFMIFPLFVMMFFGGGLEELGWRGIALPELERKYSALFSSIILGLIWIIWHIPLFFIKGVNQYGSNIFVFALGVMGLTFILSWIYNRTGSILICIIFHDSFNMAATMGFGGVVVQSSEMLRGLVASLMLIIVGLSLLMIFSTRKELGKKPDIHTNS